MKGQDGVGVTLFLGGYLKLSIFNGSGRSINVNDLKILYFQFNTNMSAKQSVHTHESKFSEQKQKLLEV